ncbi:Protein BNIP5 [Frankliniella fusca]|uniref:Protein BNIP5 n=1 Tax=Frankliniella fusca TaxID=407009 RepID=A0AAE1L929_9NEOP|nr:Protein BNIP5 [Frankliniella fusca]
MPRKMLGDYNSWLDGQSSDVVSDFVNISEKLNFNLNFKFSCAYNLTIPRLFKQPLMVHPTRKAQDNKKPSWKLNAQERTDGLLEDLEISIERAKSNCAEVGRTLQPFPVIVGPTVEDITDCYVMVDNLRYRVGSPLQVFDNCFKFYQALRCWRIWA